MHLRRDFQAQGVEPDEAGGVVLVVGPALRERVGFHHCIHLFIQTAAANLWRRAAHARFQSRSPSDDKK